MFGLLEGLLGYSVDTVIFMALAVIGLVVLLLAFVFGEVAGVVDSDFDHGGDSLFSIQSIFAGIMGFGATGWIATGYFGVNALIAALLGLAGGAAMAIPTSLLYRYFRKQQVSSGYSESDVIGTIARVSLTIPAEGMGRIQFSWKGSVNSGIARSADHSVISQGELVTIERNIGGEYYVKQVSGQA